MKRILHISKYYHPFAGGTEQVARDCVNALLDDHEQKVVCFNHEDGDAVDFIDGVEIQRLGCFAKISSQSLSVSYGKELKKIFKAFDPDVVIFHYPNPFAAHWILKYIPQDSRLVIYWHLDITKQKVLKHLFRGQTLALIQRADRIVGATPKHVDESEFTPRFGDKRRILPYMVEDGRLAITAEEAEAGERIRERYGGKTLGFFIGRHVPYKGLEYLIKASRELGDADLHFLVAGSGRLTGRLKREAKGDPKVEFVGRITDSERRSFMYACDIVCFPSVTRNEAFGLALAEGMSFGRPAVTFTIRGSGVNFVSLDGITGIECPNRDHKAYAAALKKLSGDARLRTEMGNAAARRVRENFTREVFRKNMEELIRSL